MKTVLCFIAVFAFLLAPGLCTAQTAQPAAPAISQEQFDGLVEAISRAVVRKLQADGAVVVPPKTLAQAGQATGELATEAAEEAVEQDSIRFFARAGRIASAFPQFLAGLVAIPQALSPPTAGDRTIGRFLLLLGLAGAAALAAEFVVRLFLRPLRVRFAATIDQGGGMPALILIALLDVVALATVWIAVHGLAAAWFEGDGHQSHFALLVLTSIFSWRLYMFAFRVCFRPVLPEARLAEISDQDARAIYAGIGGAILFILILRIVLRFMLATDVEVDALACGQTLSAVLIVAVFIVVAISLNKPVADWLRGLSPLIEPGRIVTVLSRHWLAIAIPFFIVLGAAQIYGALVAHFTVGAALILTLNVVIGLLLIETVIDRVRRFQIAAKVASGDARPRIADAVARCLRVALLVAAIAVVAETWVFDVLDLVDDSRFASMLGIATTVGGTVLAAYCAWEAVKFFTARYVVRHSADPGHVADHDEDAAPVTTSRVATLMPLLRVALMVVIAVLATLTVLSQFGVNVTALIAGASVVGLAVSFGSQTLVKDIVSGVFYLVDDAFRVGEYIDCGKAKGTVEGFTLRSLRLRHQNGQVHTIPFGQLGQITNFSRDWTTMKFNLRFVRDTDLEKLRKTVKKLGQDMLEDPEMKNEILVPLKMQGVADIADNAIVVRFKFTVKPNKPTFVHREALKRMFRTFPEAGIEFANAMVAVQTMGGREPDAASAGAAARAVQAQAEAARLAEAPG